MAFVWLAASLNEAGTRRYLPSRVDAKRLRAWALTSFLCRRRSSISAGVNRSGPSTTIPDGREPGTSIPAARAGAVSGIARQPRYRTAGRRSRNREHAGGRFSPLVQAFVNAAAAPDEMRD